MGTSPLALPSYIEPVPLYLLIQPYIKKKSNEFLAIYILKADSLSGYVTVPDDEIKGGVNLWYVRFPRQSNYRYLLWQSFFFYRIHIQFTFITRFFIFSCWCWCFFLPEDS